jgi:hypothetical protein
LTPHPLSTQRVCPPPAPKAGGTHSPGGEGGGESIVLKTPDIGLFSYSIIPLRIVHILESWLYTYSPRNGIAQLVGEYRNNKLSGVGKLVKEDGVVVEGYFRQTIVV